MTVADAAVKVQRALGPRLLESAYQACPAHDLQRRWHRGECEVGVPLEFEGALIEVGYRIDMRIDQLVLVEKKTVEKILPIHLAQLLTYLKLSGLSLGLIINWNVILLRDGIQRVGEFRAIRAGGRVDFDQSGVSRLGDEVRGRIHISGILAQ